MPSHRRMIVNRTRRIAGGIAEAERLELVGAEWKGPLRGGVLRVYIDGPDGITHTHCERVSRRLSAALDVEDLVPGNYTLEVSSPGLDRKLRHGSDFERFEGRRVAVRTREALRITGRIQGFTRGDVSLRTEAGESLRLPLDDIEQARLVVDW